MYIDTHCHLQFSHYDEDRPMILGNAKKAGVKKLIIPGVDMRSNNDAIHLATLHPDEIYASIGFHPYEAQTIRPDIAEKELETLLQTSRKSIVSIGECGLDYHLYKDEDATSKKGVQKELFTTQLRIAAKHTLPIIMHVRDAYEDFFTTFDAVETKPTGVIHCFSGGLQEARMAKERGLYVGVDGNVTYTKMLQQIISEIPLSQILLETDAPYLTPVPHRGERNEPKYIPLIASFIADLLHTTTAEISRQTTENAQKLFKLV